VNYVIPLIGDNLLAIKFMFWCYFHLNVGQLDEVGEKRQLASMDKMDLADGFLCPKRIRGGPGSLVCPRANPNESKQTYLVSEVDQTARDVLKKRKNERKRRK
jgi:hypothetical protein